jgi:hypothetical protein
MDTLPLFLAIAIYIPFWPGRFMRPGNAPAKTFEMIPELHRPSSTHRHEVEPIQS